MSKIPFPGLPIENLERLSHESVFPCLAVKSRFLKEKTVLTGNPVRSAILKLSENDAAAQDKAPVLLVLGGSLGAHRVNELVSSAFSLGLSALQNIKIIHQTGPADAEEIEAIYKRIILMQPSLHFLLIWQAFIKRLIYWYHVPGQPLSQN